jgi:LPXTG-motif cell wall-anchored protein
MLPATPSQSPLMTVIGALSLAAFTFLLVARRRGVDNS